MSTAMEKLYIQSIGLLVKISLSDSKTEWEGEIYTSNGILKKAS